MSDTFPDTIPDPEHRFSGLPICVDYIDGINWKLKRDISYRTKADEVATVRKRFVFDFASIPRPLYWLYPPAGDGSNLYGVAALIHDWLYCHRQIGGRPIVRKEADLTFLEIMLYIDCRKSLAYTMYYTVRSFGWIPWLRRKKEDII